MCVAKGTGELYLVWFFFKDRDLLSFIVPWSLLGLNICVSFSFLLKIGKKLQNCYLVVQSWVLKASYDPPWLNASTCLTCVDYDQMMPGAISCSLWNSRVHTAFMKWVYTSHTHTYTYMKAHIINMNWKAR